MVRGIPKSLFRQLTVFHIDSALGKDWTDRCQKEENCAPIIITQSFISYFFKSMCPSLLTVQCFFYLFSFRFCQRLL